MKSFFQKFRFTWLLPIGWLFVPAASRAAGETYYTSPSFRTYTSSNLVYKLTADTSPGSGNLITNGIIRFKVASVSGGTFSSAGTVEIHEGSVTGTLIGTFTYSQGVTETSWAAYTLPANFVSGSKTYYATRQGSPVTQIASGPLTVYANRQPVISGTPTMTLQPDKRLSVSFTASDPDADTLTCDILILDSNGNFVSGLTRTAVGASSGSQSYNYSASNASAYLTNGATYRAVVRLYDAYHNDLYTMAEATSGYFTYTLTPLNAPTITVNTSLSSSDLTATSAVPRWTVTNSASTSTGITVQVYRLPSYTLIWTDSGVSVGASGYTLSSLQASTQYQIVVTYNPQPGYSSGSNALNFYTRMAAPTLLYPTSGAYDGPPAQLGWQADANATNYGVQISTSTSGFSAATGFASTTYTATAASSVASWSGGTVGQTYWWSVRQLSSLGPNTSYYSTPQSFIYGPEPNPLGIDVSLLKGRKLGGIVHVGGYTVDSPGGQGWKTFYIREGTTNRAQAAGDFPVINVDVGRLTWRKMDGTMALAWTDILTGSGPFTLKVVGRGVTGAEIESAPFTVTLQTSLQVNVTISSGTGSFPRFQQLSGNPSATTFMAAVTGGSGTVSLAWRGAAGAGTGSSISGVINRFGLNPVRCVATDTSGNRTVAAIVAPVAYREKPGSPDQEDGGSMAVQGVDVTSGNLHLSFADMSVPAIGIPFSLVRSYDSVPSSSLGNSQWRFNLEETISYNHINSDEYGDWPSITYNRSDGSKITFFPGLDGYYHPSSPGVHDQLIEDFNAGTFTVYSGDTPPVVRVFDVMNQNARANAGYRLRSIQDLRGHGLTINYTTTTGTQISTVTDQSGRYYYFTYSDTDAPTRISLVTDFSGRSVAYDWNSYGNLSSVRDVRGYTTTFSYYTSGNGNKRLSYIQRPLGNRPISNLVYDASRRVTDITIPMGTDANGSAVNATTSFNYQSTYTDVTRPGTGNNIRFGLDSSLSITSVTESNGVANRTTQLGRLTTAQLVGQDYRANDLGLTSSSQPPSTAAAPTNYSYAANGRGLITQSSDGSGTTYVKYSSAILNAAPGTLSQNLALPSTVIDARGKTFTPSFDSSTGQLKGFLNPYSQGARITAFDSTTGLPRYSDDGRGNITEFQYTATGDIATIIVPPDPDNANRYIYFTYPSGTANRGLPASITDRKGYQTDLTWDAAGNPTLIRATNLSPGSGETRDITIAYDSNGNRSSVTDRRGKTTNFYYDNMDRPWKMELPSPDGVASRPYATTEFDSLGRAIKNRNLNGNLTEQVYGTGTTDAGFLIKTRAWKPSASSWEDLQSTTYLSDGRTSSVTDGEGITRSYVYYSPPRQHLVQRITEPTPSGYLNYREFDYDANDKVVRETTGTSDPAITQALPTTLYQYDDAGRLSKVTNVMNGNWGNPNDAAHIRTTITYFGDDQIDTISDPRQKPIQHIYNSLGRLAIRQDALSNQWTYNYDANGNLRSEGFPGNGTYPARTITRSWGVLDRLESIDYDDGVTPTVSYGYDANGNRTSMTDRWGSAIYVYDALNRPTSITRNVSGTGSQTLAYSYFAGGQLKTLTYPGSRTVTYAYDHLDRMTTVTPWTGGGFSYTWRRNGQLDLITNPNGTQTDYQYFPSNGRLSRLLTTRSGTTIADQQFSYDPVGNITRITGDVPLAPPLDPAIAMTHDNANRLATISGQSTTNDPAGRSRTLPAPLSASTSWEGMDWLSSYTTGGQTTAYTYDGNGVRLSRSRSGSTTRYLIDPTASLPNVVAENDASNNPQRFYIYGAAGLLESIDTSNNVSTYHFSHRGDTLALTNASGGVSESYGYSPYGFTAASNASSSNPFRFTGQHGVMDDGNGLHFMRARYYAAGTGRFLSIDQVAGSPQAAQTLDRFAFVTGNPLSYVDPSGFSATPTLNELEDMMATANNKKDNAQKKAELYRAKARQLSGDERKSALKKYVAMTKIAQSAEAKAAEYKAQIATLKASAESRSQREDISDRIGTAVDILDIAATGTKTPVFGMVVGGFTAGVNALDQVKSGDNAGALNTVGQYGVCQVGAPYLVGTVVTGFTVNPWAGYAAGWGTTQGCNWVMAVGPAQAAKGQLGSYTSTWTNPVQK